MVLAEGGLARTSTIFANRAFLDLTGYALVDVLQQGIEFFAGAETDAAAMARLVAAFDGCQSLAVELVQYRKDGTPFWSKTFFSPVFDESGGLVCFSLSYVDITQHKRAEIAAEALARQHAAVAALGQRALSGADPAALMEEAVKRVASALGVDAAKVLQHLPGERRLLVRAGVGWSRDVVGVAKLEADRTSPSGHAFQTGEPVVCADLSHETRFRTPPLLRDHGVLSVANVIIRGRGLPFGVLEADSTRPNHFTDDDVNFLQSMANILAAAFERRTSEDHVFRRVLHDPITGLPNRELFRDHLIHAVAHAERHGGPLAVLLADLDHFKDVNDTLGHPIGDRLLTEAGRRICRCVRAADTVARLGGDEFAIILAELRSPDDAAAVAQKVIAALAEPFRLDEHEIHIGASIGISAHPTDDRNADLLLRYADLALYQAKNEGRGTHAFFARQLAARAESKRSLEHDLRRALEHGELTLYYQPEIDLQRHRITAVEALLRWHHPLRGNVPPAEFVAVAEATGLIVPLGQWVLQRACQQASAWQRFRPGGVVLAVNLSPAQFRGGCLTQTVDQALRESGLNPGCLEIEVTESLFLDPEDSSVIQCLRRMREAGIRVAIDDLGTGYSSLGRLRNLPVGKIKVDRSFVTGIGRDPDAQVIVRALVTLGRNLGLRITAEGVETAEQLAFLRAQHCDEVQGDYLCPPISAEELTARLRTEDRVAS